MPSYGLIVEGDSDQHIFEKLIRRINSPDAVIYTRPCGGVGRLMKDFPSLLKSFRHIHGGGPVDGALVIRDTDNKSAEDVFAKMKDRLRNRTFNFPRGVELCPIRRTVDTWILADERAIDIVSQSRGGRQIARINEILEDIAQPKERLQRTLNDAKLNYSPAVLGEIASNINLEQLEGRAPSFKVFKQSVLRIWGK